MHPALYLEEVISDITKCFCPEDDKDVLQALIVTNRALSEAALDVIWANVSIWNLAQRMEASLWTIIKTSEEENMEQNYTLVST
jgi:hypothetical protein